MAWIQSHQEIGRHPKTKRAARLLGCSVPTVIGHLHLLWHWCLDFAQDGELTDYDAAEIADAALWEGESVAFVQALTEAGFFDVEGMSLFVHDWNEYGGRLIEERRADAERKRARRSGGRPTDAHGPSQQDESDVRGPSGGHPQDVPRMSAVREEKKRVEEITPPKGGGGASAPEAQTTAASAPGSILPPEVRASAEFKTLQEVSGWWWGVKRPQHDQELARSALALRNKSSPPATPENIALFGELWAASGKTKPAPGQVVSEWENVMSPPQRNKSNPGGIHASHQPSRHPERNPSAAQRRDSAWADALENVMD
ncbi:MAG TPA: hypothetical protein VGB45_02070 [Abditibacterium sp.]